MVLGETGGRGDAVEECVILFGHHNASDVTRYHLELLRKNNPYPVIPIRRGQSGVDDSIDVEHPSTIKEPLWRGADIQYLNWFRWHRVPAKRYLFLEWDVYATQPVKDFYGDLWDNPVVTVERVRPGLRYWQWFLEIPKLPEEWKMYAAGTVPLAATMVSHEVMEKVAELSYPPQVFSELRFGTAVRYCGYEISELPNCKTIHYWANSIKIGCKPSIYHPVKELQII